MARIRGNYLPSKRFVVDRQAVPTVAADLATKTTWLTRVTVANTTVAAVTFTVKDKQATPRNLFAAVSIAANSTSLVVWNDGSEEEMLSGINWFAGGAGLECSMEGFQVP